MGRRIFAISWEDIDWNATVYVLGWLVIVVPILYFAAKQVRKPSQETVARWSGWALFIALFLLLHHLVPKNEPGRNYMHLSFIALVFSAWAGVWTAGKLAPPRRLVVPASSSPQEPLPSPEEIVRASMVLKRRVAFEYQTRKDPAPVLRTVLPKRIFSNGYATLVFGFCETRNADRTFVLRRMQNVRSVE